MRMSFQCHANAVEHHPIKHIFHTFTVLQFEGECGLLLGSRWWQAHVNTESPSTLLD